MPAKRRSKAKSRRAPAKKKGSRKKPGSKDTGGSRKAASGKARGSEPKLSPPYSRSRAAGLASVPAGFVGAIVDSLIRNDGARDIDVRGREDGNFDVTRLR